ncbi:DNA polymerase III subunit delta [Hyphomicrobium sp. NDB2Meth4]|uniref:DNA polymerase III subunit delta n=1 Tax=Hyphomicrobium sp. NDB2Meth4 TaxID=1892846 RepID=UPI00092FF62B|nr:DNA polymerase III subunit delta [Hyphomicrobium sp. NDB2Meth4]
MVAIKAHQANAFLNPPGPKVPAVLFYGTDVGLVAERAQKLAALVAARDTGEIVRLDDTDLDTDPDRLAVELQTIPMFGGSKVVRVAAGRRINAAALQPLIDGNTLTATLIVEAGNLKPSDSMRALFEKSAKAAAVACYADEAADIEGLIREVLQAHGLGITSDARELLVARMGADRVMSRGEIEKLALYASGKHEVDAADIEAIVGDASELAIDRTLNAAASGDGKRAIEEFSRAIASGESPQMIIAALQRAVQRLHRIRGDLDAGASFEDVMRQQRPPVHFKQKDALGLQCRMWNSPRLNEALKRTARAAKAARLNSALEEAITEDLLLAVAALARQRAGRA